MRKVMIVIALILLFNSPAYAQKGGGMMGEGQQMTMMQNMMGQGMMMHDMMQMMMEMMKMQQKMIEGVKPAEKKAMLNEMSGMMGRMEKMMSGMKDMMPQGMMMGGAAYPDTKKEEQTGGPQKKQEKSEAGVTVKATLEGADGTIKFKIALETHTVELDKYKFDEIVVLRAGGKEYPARVKSQEGSGHHRSAVVEFDNPGSKEVEVVIKGVAGVKERVFLFQR